MATDILLGTQGWSYGAWIGSFYPSGTTGHDMLSVYARAFRTVEVDSTFYGIPAEPVVHAWREAVPADFTFALKVPQEITHDRRLIDTQGILGRFLRRVSHLAEHLGPLLVQLSPAFRPTHAHGTVLKAFLESLSQDFRWAVEFRHPDWLTAGTLELLRGRNVALVLPDGRWIRRERAYRLAREPTADFAYLRWLGTSRRLTDFSRAQFERARELRMWASAIAALDGRVAVVYGYFNNYFQGHAPHSARELQRLLGQQPVNPEALREQVELF